MVTGETCTIIDLDTAMRGYAAIDYGDAVRSVMGANCDKSRIEEVKRGFLRGAGGSTAKLKQNRCLMEFYIRWENLRRATSSTVTAKTDRKSVGRERVC